MPPEPTAGRRSGYRWTILALLFFATTINYIDRQVLGILAPTLQKDLGWSETDYGDIVSWFSLMYGIGMLGMGRLLDAIGTRKGFAFAIVAWSLAAMAHALARTAAGFSAARAFLGLGEAGNFPASVKTVSEWFPKSERALAVGIFNAGTNIGAVVAPISVPLIAARWAWLMAWWALYNTAKLHPRLHPAERKYILDGLEEPITAKVRLGEVVGYRQL